MESWITGFIKAVGTFERKYVQVDVQVEGGAKSLNKRDDATSGTPGSG